MANFPFCIIHSPLIGTMAVRITKVYTRTGDKGDTALSAVNACPKIRRTSTPCGTIDELN